MVVPNRPTVVILGAGINGCSVARELVLNGVGVLLVDARDIAYGATSRSSRLIHGGLRYLEYGEFRLVRESLAERTRLRRLAPHLVEPLRLYIPVAKRFGGLLQSAGRFLGVNDNRIGSLLQRFVSPSQRGFWTVEFGLWLYDRFAKDGQLPPHDVHDVAEQGVPQVNRSRYRWLCAYSDAQMRFPERYCVALLQDARAIAASVGVPFRFCPHSRASFQNRAMRIETADGGVIESTPPLVVNATGAWGDFTLRELHVPAPRLFGGTKGSHLVTYNRALVKAIQGAGIYAEADDGRLIFVLPFGEGVLIGTTDERFDCPPDRAVATEPEVDYLMAMVNELFPQVDLKRSDISLTYSGVRPLPAGNGPEGAISRDHSISIQERDGVPVITLVGGKLTTSRAFGEFVADRVLERLGLPRVGVTTERFVPGGSDVPNGHAALERRWNELATRFNLSLDQVRSMWSLCGSLVEQILLAQRSIDFDPRRNENVRGATLPRTFVRWIIENEWVTRLDDLVERRLMLAYAPTLSVATLGELAELLVEARAIEPNQLEPQIVGACDRLVRIYSRPNFSPITA